MSIAPHVITNIGAEHDERATWFAERVRSWGDPDAVAKWERWSAILLGAGGALVCPPMNGEPDLDSLLDHHTIHPGTATVIRGEMSGCHTNVSRLLVQGEVDAIGTGYALSPDGLWRQHSWGMRGTELIETTEAREAYAGIELRGFEAEGFAFANGGHTKAPTPRRPDKPFRIIRGKPAGHRTHAYTTKEARDEAARSFAEQDGATVITELWDITHSHDDLNQGWACDGFIEPAAATSS